jgi:hypothetical protein
MTFAIGTRGLRMGLLLCLCSVLIDRLATAATLQIGQNFRGTTYGPDSDSSPADANGAVGQDHFVELVNGRFSIYEKASGNQVQTMTDIQFWQAAGVAFSSTVGVTDPRIVYDTYSQRWFASMVDFSVNSQRQRSNHFLLAVSRTADPTGRWSGFAFAADTNSVYFADFPTLGLDQNAVYISGDMFDRLGNPVGATLVVVPKSDLLASPPSIASRHSFGILSYTSRGDVLQPAMTSGSATTPEAVLAVSDLAIDYQPHTTLILSSVLGTATGNPVLSTPPVILKVAPYVLPYNPPQPDGSNNLDNGDCRFSACVRRVGDFLYATQVADLDTRSGIRWYKINAATSAIVQSGNISDPNLDLYYPSIAANEAGTVVIACNGSSSSQFISSYAALGQTTNGILKFGSLTLLKAGTASYQNPDVTGDSRWGDYSATTLDPADPTRFWTVQMIAVSPSAWATQITELLTAGDSGPGTNVVPNLAISYSGTNVVISWPAASVPVQLQFTPELAPSPAWTPVSQTPAVTNNVDSVLIPMLSTNGFFRLSTATPQ